MLRKCIAGITMILPLMTDALNLKLYNNFYTFIIHLTWLALEI